MVKETYGCQAVSIDCLPTAGLSLDDDRLQSRAFGDHYRLESDPGHLDRKAQIGQFPRRNSSSIATNGRTRLASSVPTLVLPGNFSL